MKPLNIKNLLLLAGCRSIKAGVRSTYSFGFKGRKLVLVYETPSSLRITCYNTREEFEADFIKRYTRLSGLNHTFLYPSGEQIMFNYYKKQNG